MVKISRPIVFTLLAGIAAYALVLNTQPQAAPGKALHITTAVAAVTDDDYGAQDKTIHFPRYKGGIRDPFLPGVAPVDSAGGPATDRAGWALTGITMLNGVTSALLENATTGDSKFLKAGDSWNGLRVLRVESDSVVFENALAQQTRLAFSQRAPDETAPGLDQVAPLPPMPVTRAMAQMQGGRPDPIVMQGGSN
jgi:hypothetical protein